MDQHEPRASTDQGGWWVATFVIGMLALIVAIIAVIGAFGNDANATTPAGSTAAGGVTEVDVTLGDITMTPSSIDVPAGQRISVHVHNAGAMAHDFKVLGSAGTASLAPGSDESIEIGPFTTDSQRGAPSPVTRRPAW